MPSFRGAHVSFPHPPTYSRPPRDDETYVMRAFACHASHCSSCADPYAVHLAGTTLCPKGHQRALDVAQYVYHQAGKAYSTVDSRHSAQPPVQIEIPAGCESVRSLLRAMERGLRIMKRAPSVSYDRTYFVAPRPAAPRREASYLRKPKLETAEPPEWARTEVAKERSRGKVKGKGSLYEEGMKEREKMYKPSVFYIVKPAREAAPPVPPKDHRW